MRKNSEITILCAEDWFFHNTISFQYEFNWEVKDREAKADGAFFTHNEKKEEANPDRTEGEYRVWLPDGR